MQCTGYTEIYNIHVKIFRKKKWRVRQFFHCDANTYISLILLLMQIIVIIRGKTLPSNKSQNR